MKCANCDYLLFNLTQPVCPECGVTFDVTGYRFEPDSVSFHCPHCDQQYYGNDAQGLPYPREFECVRCRQHIELRQMRVVPQRHDAVGLAYELSPWDRRPELGLRRAWWGTVVMTLLKPGLFFRSHAGQSTREAWLFSMITLYVGLLPYCLYTIGFLWLVGVLLPKLSPPGAVPTVMPSMGWAVPVYLAIGLISPLFAPFVAGGVWACLIHAGLFFLAPKRKTMTHTVRTVMYAYGPYALMVVPLCGAYACAVWYLVTLIHGIKEVHQTTGWRASVAVLAPVMILVILYGVWIILFIIKMPAFTPPPAPSPAAGSL